MYWAAKSFENINTIVTEALNMNSSYHKHKIMGIPATYLDPKIFPPNADFLYNSPYIRCFIENPNHIGLHTYNSSLPTFKGTQKIELDLLRICAEEIFQGETNSYDGYIAPGGTECNIQALWIFREYFIKKSNSKIDEIAVLFSEDSHYSIHKACNILRLNFQQIKVNFNNRHLDLEYLEKIINKLKHKGVKYFIFVLNLGTTMFGSIDPISKINAIIKSHNLNHRVHIDAAFGGFIYPFISPNNEFSFNNTLIDSISLDGHKMLEAPYGTGIFLIRKNLINNVLTKEASYIQGLDHTLCGSRSGANAIATWMILNIYGSGGIIRRMKEFIKKTDKICDTLNKLNIDYVRNKNMNIISILDGEIPKNICTKYTLVPDTHIKKPTWWKIVVMEHVNWNLVNKFINDLKVSLTTNTRN